MNSKKRKLVLYILIGTLFIFFINTAPVFAANDNSTEIPEPTIEVSLTATNHFIGESVTLFGTVEQIIEYPETLDFSQVSVVDTMGVISSDVFVDQHIKIKSNMTNSQSNEQEFVYVVQILNKNNFVDSLTWLSGSLSPEQSLNLALSWIPSTNGTYDVQVFVWDNLDSPLSLTSSLEFELDVGSSPSFEEITLSSTTIRNLPILIQVISPDGNIVFIDEIQSFSDKYFSSLIKLDGDLFQKLGQYEIIISYGATNTFNSFSIIEDDVEESIQIPYGAIQIIIPEDSSECDQGNPCFTPSVVTVEPGQPVVWVNYYDSVHTVVSGALSNDLSDSFNSGMISSDTFFSHTFYQQGTFDYFCQLHPWMEGQVIVEVIPEDIPEDIIPDEISCESNEILVDGQCVVEVIIEQIPNTILVSTEKIDYLYDDEINVIVDTTYTGEFTIQFIDPNGLKILSDTTTDLSSKFKARGSLWQNNGTYSIVLLVDDVIKGETTFSMGYAPSVILSTENTQTSSDPDDDDTPDDTPVPTNQELILKNPKTVNGMGNKIDTFLPDQSVQIASDIFNYNEFEQSFAYVLKVKDSLGKTSDPKWITGLLNPDQSLTPSLSWTPKVGGMHVIMIEIWNNPTDRTLLSPPVEFSINVDDIILSSKQTKSTNQILDAVPQSVPITESTDLGFASFVDETKDAQSYVNRYNNEASYKEWFDENYSEYDSIYQAVGLEEPDTTIPEPTYQLEPACGEGTIEVNGICQVKHTTASEILNSESKCDDGTKLVNDVCILTEKINKSKHSKNFKSSTVPVTETSCGFGTELKDGTCQAKRIISFSFERIFSSFKNFFSFR